MGDSGSGKTSIGLAGLISQLIRFGDASLVVIDLKADDLALFRNTRAEARYLQMRLKKENPEATYRFRWFTPEIDHSTYVFNPLTQEHFRTLTIYQRADVLTAALGLHYGTEYGRSHFSDANTQLLFEALQKCPNPSSFLELAEVLHNKKDFSGKLRQDASHLIRIIERLAVCEPLNVACGDQKHAPALQHAIDFADVFRTPQAVFLHLPSAIGAVGAAEIARLAFYSLLSAAKHVGSARKQVYLLIDEFQIMAASNLEIILQTARSMNIAVILANQSLHNLEAHGESLIPTIRACTRFRQVFAATDHPRQSIIHIRRGDGYAQYGGMPFVMTSTHHVSYERYLKRKNSAWPKHRPDETLVPELKMPKIRTQVPTAINPDETPDPVIETESPSAQETAAPDSEEKPASNEAINGLWSDHEKRKAKTEKRLARKKRSKPSSEGKDDTNE